MTVIEISSWARDGGLTPRQTGQQTVGRKVTLTLTLTERIRDSKSWNEKRTERMTESLAPHTHTVWPSDRPAGGTDGLTGFLQAKLCVP
jgi:hypothetical protein